MPVGHALPRRLLSPIDRGLDLHQAHEGAAEAAGAGEPKKRGNINDALVGFRKQMAGRIDAHFSDQLAIARAHFGDTALKRAAANSELARRSR
jgi:hypothetical protein